MRERVGNLVFELYIFLDTRNIFSQQEAVVWKLEWKIRFETPSPLLSNPEFLYSVKEGCVRKRHNGKCFLIGTIIYQRK